MEWNGMVWRVRKIEKMEWLKWAGQTNGKYGNFIL